MPFITYKDLVSSTEKEEQEYRFLGKIESLTDTSLVWVKNEEVTVCVEVKNALIYLLPPNTAETAALQRVQWNKLTVLDEGVKVFIGGSLVPEKNIKVFSSTKDRPLIIILYEGDDREFVIRTIQAGRQVNEYWNPVTPFSLTIGVFCQLYIVALYSARPAYYFTALLALIVLFGPLFPFLPPGVLCTSAYRRFWEKARYYRACRDVIRLPLYHLLPESSSGVLPDGTVYGYAVYSQLPSPLPINVQILPSIQTPSGSLFHMYSPIKPEKGEQWYWFGAFPALDTSKPEMPADPMAIYAIFPGHPVKLSEKCVRQAHHLEILAGLSLVAGILMNCCCIALLVYFTYR
jgi:hypothetical protein